VGSTDMPGEIERKGVGRTVKDDLHRIATGLPQTLVQQEF